MAKLALIFKMTLVVIASTVIASCTTVEQVKANKEIYCSQFYKGMRAVGRGALSATTGVVVPDVCDTIDAIVEEENSDA